ncbi:hypothetical protein [Pseudomonas amygdali]|uniref:hypothetical protein n=1 Tax=Pseudomonas amygdali TaxID=47877 RepID=UPI0011C3CCAD|nr:hypothetical protein [Pseudomonas amygdali]
MSIQIICSKMKKIRIAAGLVVLASASQANAYTSADIKYAGYDDPYTYTCPYSSNGKIQTSGGYPNGKSVRQGWVPAYQIQDWENFYLSEIMYKNKDNTFYTPEIIPAYSDQYGDHVAMRVPARKIDVELRGYWEQGSELECADVPDDEPEPETPVTPVDPEVDNSDPIFSFVNTVSVNCPAGQTVGGITNGKAYRNGEIDYYGKSVNYNWTYFTKDKTNHFDKVEMVEKDGISYFPAYSESEVEKYGKFTDEACATPAPPLPTYSFDLAYNEYCKFGETVGGVQGGSSLRTGKVPVYFLFDTSTFTTKNYFFDGVNYTPIQMVEQNGYSTFPQITEEMVKKYGSLDTNSIPACQAVPVTLPEPTPPQEGWIEFGYENCAAGSTVGGVADGATQRMGTVSVWYGFDSYGTQQYYFHSAKTGDLIPFDFSDFDTYVEPSWDIGKGNIDQYGTWEHDSVQACTPVRTATDAVETKTENCTAPLTGTITFERQYKQWSDGVKDQYGDWSVTSNACVVPPVVVDPMPPVTVPTDPEPTDDFVTIPEFELSREMCEEGQVGEKTFRLDWTYDLYADGRKDNYTPKTRTALTNTCKTLTDDLIETTPRELSEKCPSGQVGNIIITGQDVTYSLSGTKFVEISRQNNCVAELSDFESEFKTENCPAGQSGTVKSVRYYAIKTDGSKVYPYGETYSVSENTCTSPSEADVSNEIANGTARGILANQSVKASDTAQVKIITDYVNNATADFGDYKLNISVDSIAVDSKKLGALTHAWVSKTGGKINLGSLPRSPIAYIGKGGITKANASKTVIRDVSFSQSTGKLTVRYTQSISALDTGSVQSFEVPLIDAGQAGSSLNSIRAY